jgi:hypothetical protein
MQTQSDDQNNNKILITLLNRNGEPHLKGCLNSLKQQTYSNFDVFIVDNGSTDHSVDIIKQELPECVLVIKDRNYGTTITRNEGMKHALKINAKYVLFLDNDTICKEDLLEKLVETIESNHKIGICGPKVLDMKKPTFIQELGMDCDIFGFPYSKYRLQTNCPDNIFTALFTSACCMLIKTEVIKKIGFLDREFLNCEDLDYCWRAKLFGYNTAINPNAIVYHLGGGTGIFGIESHKTTLKGRYSTEKCALRSMLKNYSTLTLFFIIPLYLIASFFEVLIYFIISPKLVKSFINAIVWNIKNFNSTWSLHNQIQNERVVNDIQIMKMMIGSSKLRTVVKYGIPTIGR